MLIQAVTTIDQHGLFDLRSISNRGADRLETGVSGVTISNDFSGRLSVRTTEGDTIRIAKDLETDYRAGRFGVQSGSGRAAVNVGAEYARYTLQRDFGITVDGDLNEQELSDLQRLLHKIANIFHGFVEGQGEKALAQTTALAERFDQLTTLSGLDLNIEVVRSVTVVAASASTPGGAPMTTAAIPLLSNGTTAPTPSFDASEDGGLLALGSDQQRASLIQEVFDALKEAETKWQKFQKYLPDFFETLHEDLMGRLDGSAKRKGEAQEQLVEQSPSTISKEIVVTAYSSVDLDTSLFSIQG